MRLRLLLVLIAGVSILIAGCVNEKLTESKDSKGWHLKFEGVNTTTETMYPVKKGMKTKIAVKLKRGELKILMVINGKEIFEKNFNESKEINYTIPITGDCLVKVCIKNAYGKFDFLI